MEPWQQEALRQRQLERRKERLPRCQCCGRPITRSHCLDLEAFGLAAVACETCVEANICPTEQKGAYENV